MHARVNKSFSFIRFPRDHKEGTKAILRQMLRAIHHVHENNVVHRDIKPDNYLIKVSYQKNINVEDIRYFIK